MAEWGKALPLTAGRFSLLPEFDIGSEHAIIYDVTWYKALLKLCTMYHHRLTPSFQARCKFCNNNDKKKNDNNDNNNDNDNNDDYNHNIMKIKSTTMITILITITVIIIVIVIIMIKYYY